MFQGQFFCHMVIRKCHQAATKISGEAELLRQAGNISDDRHEFKECAATTSVRQKTHSLV